MSNRIILMRLLPLLPVLALTGLAFPAQAQQPPNVDLVALAFVGFADGAQVSNGPEPTSITQTGPGTFSGTTAGVPGMSLLVVETTPCRFDLTFAEAGQTFRVRLDLGLIRSVSYRLGGSLGLPEPIRPYDLELEGEPGMAVRPLEDGSTEPLENSPSLASSATIEQLRSAATALKAACPTR